MDPQPAVVTVRFNKFLPYWAVLQTDLRQTFRSWVYRLWVFMTVLAAAGFLLYRVGVHKEAGLSQSAAAQCGELFRILIVGMGVCSPGGLLFLLALVFSSNVNLDKPIWFILALLGGAGAFVLQKRLSLA